MTEWATLHVPFEELKATIGIQSSLEFGKADVERYSAMIARR